MFVNLALLLEPKNIVKKTLKSGDNMMKIGIKKLNLLLMNGNNKVVKSVGKLKFGF